MGTSKKNSPESETDCLGVAALWAACDTACDETFWLEIAQEAYQEIDWHRVRTVLREDCAAQCAALAGTPDEEMDQIDWFDAEVMADKEEWASRCVRGEARRTTDDAARHLASLSPPLRAAIAGLARARTARRRLIGEDHVQCR